MPDQALAQLGNSLRDARLKCGLTQEELAETANLSKKYISSIERGKSNPTYDVLRRLIIALDIPAEALFRTSADGKSSEEKEAVTSFFGYSPQEQRRFVEMMRQLTEELSRHL